MTMVTASVTSGRELWLSDSNTIRDIHRLDRHLCGNWVSERIQVHVLMIWLLWNIHLSDAMNDWVPGVSLLRQSLRSLRWSPSTNSPPPHSPPRQQSVAHPTPLVVASRRLLPTITPGSPAYLAASITDSIFPQQTPPVSYRDSPILASYSGNLNGAIGLRAANTATGARCTC